jgi:predicted  nucleic acid-binding Zn-ribbon protein
MTDQLITTIVSTGGAVIVGLAGIWASAQQLGKRMDDMNKRIDDLNRRMDRLEDSFNTFKDVVNSKFAALDSEIARILDRIGDNRK